MESVSVLKIGDSPNENARNKIRLFTSSFTENEKKILPVFDGLTNSWIDDLPLVPYINNLD